MSVSIRIGDCRKLLADMPSGSVQCIVTSPPYFGLRDYGVDGQIGLEDSPEAFVAEMVAVFREARRVLADDGTLWLNLGDSYSASGKGGGGGSIQNDDVGTKISAANARRTPMHSYKRKELLGIPWRVAFALQADGWYLRQDIVWSKPNPMPESVTDRCTKSHEYIFLLTKSERYYFDHLAIKEPATDKGRANGRNGRTEDKRARPPGSNPRTLARIDFSERGRNKRSVWHVPVASFGGAHFATFPPALIEPCILAGCPHGGTVLDPFGGAGTTGLVADRLGRHAVLIELNVDYAEMARHRIHGAAPLFAEAAA